LTPDGDECPVRVNLPTVSTETGKPMVLMLDPAVAVAVLKTTAGYENLFLENLPPELQPPKAIHEMSTAEFMTARRRVKRQGLA
jgi:hypothetical protein